MTTCTHRPRRWFRHSCCDSFPSRFYKQTILLFVRRSCCLTIVVSASKTISTAKGASAEEGIAMLVWYSPQEGLFIGKSQSIPGKSGQILNIHSWQIQLNRDTEVLRSNFSSGPFTQLSANGPLLTSLFLFQGKLAPSKMLHFRSNLASLSSTTSTKTYCNNDFQFWH